MPANVYLVSMVETSIGIRSIFCQDNTRLVSDNMAILIGMRHALGQDNTRLVSDNMAILIGMRHALGQATETATFLDTPLSTQSVITGGPGLSGELETPIGTQFVLSIIAGGSNELETPIGTQVVYASKPYEYYRAATTPPSKQRFFIG